MLENISNLISMNMQNSNGFQNQIGTSDPQSNISFPANLFQEPLGRSFEEGVTNPVREAIIDD